MVSPLELLESKDDRIPPFLTDKWNPIMFAIGGFGAVCFINFGTRRPVFSGIQKHIAATLGAGLLGKYLDDKRNDHLAERDAVLRHYIQLHPDKFPEPERKRFGEIIEPWVPIR